MTACYQPDICRNDAKRGCIVCDDDAARDMETEELDDYDGDSE